MKIPTPSIRMFCLSGILLLIGTAVAAGWIVHQRAAGTGPASALETRARGIIGWGFVDVEDGIAYLHPSLPGIVHQVYAKEGEKVKEGDLLLSLDNRMQIVALEQAQADLDAARTTLADAERKLVKGKQFEIDIQKTSIDVAKSRLEAARAELNVQQALQKSRKSSILTGTDALVAGNVNNVKTLERIVDAEQLILGKLECDLQVQIDLARCNVKAKEAQRDLAQLAVVQCNLYAPDDGVVLRLFAARGDMLNSQGRQYAVHFCPDAPRVIRAEILQEWAGKIEKGQVAYVEDDTRHGPQWKGKVERVSDQFTRRRSTLQEPFQYNDVRTLECIISLEAGSPALLHGQRMRVIIKQGKP